MFMTLIRDRRSIRQFTDKPVEKEKVDLLIEGGLRSPSSRGLNPWEFIVIKKRPTLEKLSRSKPHGAGFLKNAALGIAVIADPEKCDVWIEDSSIASTYIQLAAKSMGLESCWVQIRERFYENSVSAENRVAQILNIPENYRVESIIAIGYSNEKKPGHKKDSLLYDKVHYEKY